MSVIEKKKKNYLKLDVYGTSGEKTGDSVVLPEEIFGARVNQRLLDDVVRSYAANQRRGTHSTKRRAEVSGGGKKPWKQKGTGRARIGSIRAPHWRGGGTVFGPHPRDYSVHIPKQLRKAALISALSAKAAQENLVILESLELSSAKTKELSGAIKGLKLNNARVLCVVSAIDEKLKRASGNIYEKFALRTADDVAAYHIARRAKLVLEKKTIALLQERISGEKAEVIPVVKKPRASKSKVKA